MKIRFFQQGFNYSQDGPGNRLVFHLQGCNLKCPWCSNPEGMDRNTSKCKCVSIEEMEALCQRCRPMFFDGGGVTFTGGEVTMQFEALKELLARLKREGIHACIETNATHPSLPELFPMLNLLIADLKHTDEDIHRKFTGMGLKTVKKNLRAAAISGIPCAIRIPLVGGFNASIEYIPRFITFFQELLGLGGNFTVECLPYHDYGKAKWEALGKDYVLGTAAFVKGSLVQEFERAFQQAGIQVVRT